jgi:hypothetical protein
MGEQVGLDIVPEGVVLFDPGSRRALASERHPGGPRLDRAPAATAAATAAHPRQAEVAHG